MKKFHVSLLSLVFVIGMAHAGESCCPVSGKKEAKAAKADTAQMVAKADASCPEMAKADCSPEDCLAKGKDPASCGGFAASKVIGAETLASLKLTPEQIASVDKAYSGKSLHCDVTRAECGKELADTLTPEQIQVIDNSLAKLGEQAKAAKVN